MDNLFKKSIDRNAINSEELEVLRKIANHLEIVYSQNDISVKNGSIVKINLKSSGVKTLPDSIRLLRNLKTLHLNGNRLKKIPDAIRKIKTLSHLDLHNNILTTLPKWIIELDRLKILNLANNSFKKYPAVLHKSKSLISTDFTGNPIQFESIDQWGKMNQLLQMIETRKFDFFKEIGLLKDQVLSYETFENLPPESILSEWWKRERSNWPKNVQWNVSSFYQWIFLRCTICQYIVVKKDIQCFRCKSWICCSYFCLDIENYGVFHLCYECSIRIIRRVSGQESQGEEELNRIVDNLESYKDEIRLGIKCETNNSILSFLDHVKPKRDSWFVRFTHSCLNCKEFCEYLGEYNEKRREFVDKCCKCREEAIESSCNSCVEM